MTSDSPANPIYARLTRGSRGPSERGAQWIGVGAGMAGAILVIALMAASDHLPDAAITLAVFLLMLTLAALCLLTGFALAVMITARYASDEDHALLRLSHLSASTIVSGYTDGLANRLRVMREVGKWLPALTTGGDLLASTFLLAWQCPGPGCGGFVALYVCASLLPLSFVVGIEALLFDRMWGSAVSLGVWAGLRWASQPLSAISVVILSVLFATVPLAVGLILYPAVTLSLMGCVGLILAAWMPRLSSYLNKIARKHAIQLIATQTGV